MYLKLRDVYIFWLSVLVAHITFLYIRQPYFNYSKVSFMVSLILIVTMLPEIVRHSFNKYFELNIYGILISGSIILSAVMNRGPYVRASLLSFRAAFAFVCLFLFLEYSIEKDILIHNMRIVFWVLLIYCILSDVFMIVAPTGSWTISGEFNQIFLVGSKFDLSYLHFILVVLFPHVYGKNYLYEYAMLAWTLIVSFYSGCNTMVIGGVAYAFLMIFFEPMKKLLYSKIFLIGFIIFFSVVLIIASEILQIPIVQSIIMNVLHENATLSGRLNIYTRLDTLMLVNPIWGVSYDSNYDFSIFYANAPNYQNGLLDLYVSWGAIGVILFFAALILSSKYAEKLKDKSMISAIYMFGILGSVEIVFRSMIYIFAFLLYMFYKNNEIHGQKDLQ